MSKTLIDFIPSLSSASKIFLGKVAEPGLLKANAIELVTFYNSFPSVYDIESGILEQIKDNSKEQRNLIFNSLYKELSTISDTYQNHKSLFDGLEVRHIWDSELLYIEKEIDKQLKKTRQASEELREVSNSYEMTPFNGMSNNEVEILERRLDKLINEYNNEKEKLNKLYDEKNQIKDLIRNIPDDIFKLIAQKSESLISIVQKYLEEPQKSIETINGEKTMAYFPMSLVSSIYEVCNGKQFEEMSEIEFFHSLNLYPNYKPITPKKGEKTRICYLINQLSNTLSQEKKVQWLKDILKLVGIDYSFYRAKYRDAVGDLPSEANQEFAESLKEIFLKNN